MEKTYNPKNFENRIYDQWEKSGSFTPDRDPDKTPFTIVMPPPNITGQLHMGHALDQTLQDLIIRWKRMEGYSALWLPGTDHASIATEVKVVEKIKAEEGKSKEDLGRDAFLERAWEWKETFGGKITEQVRKLGNSCDWTRERFTMDEGCNKAVTEFFVHLYEKGLIYKGNRLVNWCPSCSTTISEAEVEHEEKQGNYYYLKYVSTENPEDYVVIATSRPETIFGDVAIAAHPDDPRYKDLVGKTYKVPMTEFVVPIIHDFYPDMEKGTGAVKITPAHDQNDFEVGERHDLRRPIALNPDGTMSELAGKYEGMDRFACRKALIKDLEAAGLVEKIEAMDINIGACYRCNTVIEPLLSDQWFVKMEELAKPAIEAAHNGDLNHVPERFEKTYLHWLENIRDWCVSRQLWWGHRIPAYYCECGEIIVSKTKPTQCPHCMSQKIKQDEDVLDTWFSSALWPFSTLGWPDKTPDLDYFYPTNVLVTGYDIIFFWVVRMVFSALEITGEVPFDHVYIHGLVRDKDGRKMSKSLGNGVDPLEIIDQYGADALRFTLINGISPGNDTRFQLEKVESNRNFANKLWNASRFVLMHEEKMVATEETLKEALEIEDQWILSRLNQVVEQVTHNMDKYEYGIASQKLYDFIWNEYCDWYIELVKERLYADEAPVQLSRATAIYVLRYVLKDILKLLHPMMPFITEEIWQSLEGGDGLLITAKWPEVKAENHFPEAESTLATIMNVIKGVRNIRATADTPPSKKLSAMVVTRDKEKSHMLEGKAHILSLGNLTNLAFVEDKETIEEDVMSGIVDYVEIFIPSNELIDYEAELIRLEKEIIKIEGEVKRVKGKLSNPGFVDKAPDHVVQEEREKQVKYEEILEKTKARIADIKGKVN